MNRLRTLQKLTGTPHPTGRTNLKTRRLAWRGDFRTFARQLDIVDKDGIRRKLEPHAIQRALEDARTGRDIVLKPRQVGLTTWELARDLWIFLTREAVRVVIVVQTDSDHKPLRETSEKIRLMLESLNTAFPWRAQTVSQWSLGDSMLSIVEAGASEAKAQKQGRGGTIHRLHITELAFFEFARETLNAILEAVPQSAEVCIESTANGASGVFYERYQRARIGDGDYHAHFFRWHDHAEYRTTLKPDETIEPITPREYELVDRYGASLEQLKWYRNKVADKGQDLVDQEYPLDEETCWLSAGRQFFDRARSVELKSLTRPPIAIEGDLHVFEQPIRGATYVVVADPSEGVGGDPGAAVVYGRGGKHVATLHGQFPTWKMGELLDAVGRKYNTAVVVVERNNHGHAVIQALEFPPKSENQRRPYPKLYRGTDGRIGWVTTEITRSAALEALESGHRGGEWSTPDARVLGEMLTFVVNKHGKPEAQAGSHDDLVLATAIMWSLLRTTRTTSYDLTNLPRAI